MFCSDDRPDWVKTRTFPFSERGILIRNEALIELRIEYVVLSFSFFVDSNRYKIHVFFCKIVILIIALEPNEPSHVPKKSGTPPLSETKRMDKHQ
jgi:hypothetical protein